MLKQKVYEVGTLVLADRPQVDLMAVFPPITDIITDITVAKRQPGVIIKRYYRDIRNYHNRPAFGKPEKAELYYDIRWSDGIILDYKAKELKALIKSGQFEIVSEAQVDERKN